MWDARNPKFCMRKVSLSVMSFVAEPLFLSDNFPTFVLTLSYQVLNIDPDSTSSSAAFEFQRCIFFAMSLYSFMVFVYSIGFSFSQSPNSISCSSDRSRDFFFFFAAVAVGGTDACACEGDGDLDRDLVSSCWSCSAASSATDASCDDLWPLGGPLWQDVSFWLAFRRFHKMRHVRDPIAEWWNQRISDCLYTSFWLSGAVHIGPCHYRVGLGWSVYTLCWSVFIRGCPCLCRVGPSLCRDRSGPSVVIRVGAVLIPCCSRICPCLAGFVRVAAVLPPAWRSLDDRRRSTTPKSARIITDLDPAGSGIFRDCRVDPCLYGTRALTSLYDAT